MTQVLFQEIMDEIDEMMSKQNRTILMLMDNASCHAVTKQYKHIAFKKLPANTTSKLQPNDAGIIHSIKARYRKLHLSYIVEYLKEHDKLPKPDVLHAMKLLREAWDGVSVQTVKNCWTETGFFSVVVYQFDQKQVVIQRKTGIVNLGASPDLGNEYAIVEEITKIISLLNLAEPMTAQEFVKIDENEPTEDEITDKEMTTTAAVAAGLLKEPEEPNDDEEDKESEHGQEETQRILKPATTIREAIHSCETLISFCNQEGWEETKGLTKFLGKLKAKREQGLKQATLSSFFEPLPSNANGKASPTAVDNKMETE